jgi:nucleoid DNA-binding protein
MTRTRASQRTGGKGTELHAISVVDAIRKGEKVTLVGFGTFSPCSAELGAIRKLVRN